MREAIIAIIVGVVSTLLANALGRLDQDFSAFSNGDILSIIQVVMIVYLIGEVRHIRDQQKDTRSAWVKWLPRW